MESHGKVLIESKETILDISNSVLLDDIKITLNLSKQDEYSIGAELNIKLLISNLGQAFNMLREEHCLVYVKNKNDEVVFKGEIITSNDSVISILPETIPGQLLHLILSVEGDYYRGIDLCL